MLNCFSSSAHDDDYRYVPSVLPQISASTRANHPSRSPLVKRPSLRFDKKRPSYGSTSDGEKRALRKAMIGNPTGFKHVGGSGIVVEMSEKSSVKPPIPPRPLSVQTPPRYASNSKPLAPLASFATTSTPLPRPPPRDRPFSLPVPPRNPLSEQSNQQLVVENHKIVRRQSLSPPPKRKPAPPITPSLIQQVEGIVGSKETRPQGTTRLEELREKEPKKSELEIEDLFSKSELRVIEKYEDVAEGRVETVKSNLVGAGAKEEEMAWKGALKEIELALR
ncbi:hypothetical protein JCM5350_002084 [Sporobolomyces pararoseus]